MGGLGLALGPGLRVWVLRLVVVVLLRDEIGMSRQVMYGANLLVQRLAIADLFLGREKRPSGGTCGAVGVGVGPGQRDRPAVGGGF